MAKGGDWGCDWRWTQCTRQASRLRGGQASATKIRQQREQLGKINGTKVQRAAGNVPGVAASSGMPRIRPTGAHPPPPQSIPLASKVLVVWTTAFSTACRGRQSARQRRSWLRALPLPLLGAAAGRHHCYTTSRCPPPRTLLIATATQGSWQRVLAGWRAGGWALGRVAPPQLLLVAKGACQGRWCFRGWGLLPGCGAPPGGSRGRRRLQTS